jgi:mycofactocin glycosyltransferase
MGRGRGVAESGDGGSARSWTSRLAVVRGRYEAARSPLDLGPSEGRVAPGTRISYVPAAALLARVEPLLAAGGFDPRLRNGEDVDLVWRLVATHRARYEPAARVVHEPRATWRGWLGQRAGYGRSAAPLDARHPGALPPAVVNRWSLGAWLLAAAGHPLAGLLVAAGATVALARRLGTGRTGAGRTGAEARPSTPGAGPADTRRDAATLALLLAARGTIGAGQQLAAATTRTWWPLALAAATTSRRARPVVAAALVGPALLEWWERRPALDPVTFTALRTLDDAAYGWGVWAGCLRERRLGPLLPRVT